MNRRSPLLVVMVSAWLLACSRDAIDIDAAPGKGRAALTGRVTDRAGATIAGAQVCVQPWSPGHDMVRPTCTEADAEGRYRVEAPPGRLRVSAMAPGFVAGLYVRGAGARATRSVDARAAVVTRDVDVRLAPGGVEVHGRVLDLHGAPVAGATVRADDAMTLAGGDGAFTLWLAPGGHRWVTAGAEGFSSGGESGPAPGHAFVVYLSPEAAIVGTVVRASDGTPVAGATIRVSDDRRDDPQLEVRSAADGSFRAGGLTGGVYRARALTDDAYGEASNPVTLAMGETATLAITAHTTFTIEGRVVAVDGEACAEGTVYLFRETDKNERQGDIGADGLARVQGLDPGLYSVSVRCEGMLPGGPDAPVEVVDRGVRGLTWTVNPGAKLRGVVVDSAGTPVPEMRVLAHHDPKDSGQPSWLPWNTWTDADGVFEIGGLMPGLYRLQLNSWEISRQDPEPWPEVQVAADAVAEVAVRLPPTTELRGQVRDTHGAPAAQVEVELSTASSVLTADDGSYVFPYAPVGESWVRARASGVRSEIREVTLRPGEPATIDATIPARTERISGRVLAQGRPVVGARVEVEREGWYPHTSDEPLTRVPPALTGDDGTFTLSGLASGKYEVKVERAGGGEVRRVVGTGEVVVLHIEAPGSIVGTVRVRSRGTPDDFDVSLFAAGTTYHRFEHLAETGGAWRFPAVPPGEYSLLVSIAGQQVKRSMTLAAGEAITGVDLEVEPNVVVRGTTIDEAGAPIVGIEVELVGEGRRITDAAGRFAFEQVSPGRMKLEVKGTVVRRQIFESGVSLDGDGYGRLRRTLEVLDAPAELELAPIRMVKDRLVGHDWGGNLGYWAQEHDRQEGPPEPRGPKVLHVYPGEQAARAGLRTGDEIVAVDGVDVTGDNRWLYTRLRQVPPGTTITLTLARGVSVKVKASEPIRRTPRWR